MDIENREMDEENRPMDKLRRGSRKTTQSAAQAVYARVMRWISTAALITMAVVFVLYIMDVLPSRLDVEEIARHWHSSSDVFHQRLESYTGWQWLRCLAYADALSMGTIAVLAATTPVCLLVVGVAYARNKNRVYAVMAVVQTAVLALAASGLLGGAP